MEAANNQGAISTSEWSLKVKNTNVWVLKRILGIEGHNGNEDFPMNKDDTATIQDIVQDTQEQSKDSPMSEDATTTIWNITQDTDDQSKEHRGLKRPLSPEEGEIVEVPKNTQTHKRKIRLQRQKERELQDYRKAYQDGYSSGLSQGLQNGMTKALEAIYAGDKLYLHLVSPQSALVATLKAVEIRNGRPLHPDDLEVKEAQTTWISQPGIHLAIDTTSNEVVFAARISPWNTMSSKQKNHTQETLSILMDWSLTVNPITTNASQNRPHGDSKVPNQYGIMKAIGWHQAMEKGKTIVPYAPASSSKALKIYESTMVRLPQVAAMYRDRLCTLLPHAGRQLLEETQELGIPSFATLSLDSDTPEQPFANSLTLTSHDFKNFLHKDNDFHAITYGMWWATSSGGKLGPHAFADDIDHGSIHGGHFFNAEFNIGVDFTSCKGLVEIFWRGKLDHHCTMESSSKTGTTRWGTSIQVTKKGVDAIAAFQQHGDPTRTYSYYQRVANLEAVLAKAGKRRKN